MIKLSPWKYVQNILSVCLSFPSAFFESKFLSLPPPPHHLPPPYVFKLPSSPVCSNLHRCQPASHRWRPAGFSFTFCHPPQTIIPPHPPTPTSTIAPEPPPRMLLPTRSDPIIVETTKARAQGLLLDNNAKNILIILPCTSVSQWSYRIAAINWKNTILDEGSTSLLLILLYNAKTAIRAKNGSGWLGD